MSVAKETAVLVDLGGHQQSGGSLHAFCVRAVGVKKASLTAATHKQADPGAGRTVRRRDIG